MNKTVRRGTWILLQHFCPADAEALTVWYFVSNNFEAYRVKSFNSFSFLLSYMRNVVLNSEYPE